MAVCPNCKGVGEVGYHGGGPGHLAEVRQCTVCVGRGTVADAVLQTDAVSNAGAVRERWPVLAKWASGEVTLTHELVRDLRDVLGFMGAGRGQDPSTDIANVNAAYRIEHKLACHYRAALEQIASLKARPVLDRWDCEGRSRRLAEKALKFDPLESDATR